ncbi:hypothetical protein BN14_09776 [Rhizoctonia solani AG-1 IB]|uniref:CHAT domain-containing protein n=1 Tax=Thanatephorus cucumeris (strain AG1-IB / isolate 7/3/14) TaxID=1108050 RepID=M5C6U4_THACB|nr:hypothetical protein BN14_09776 [Rhizoctonia solani AG-1 IB]
MAIEYQSRALALDPEDQPFAARRLTYLGIAYKNRHRSLDKLDDIEKAIECDSRALALTPNSDSELPIRLANIGLSHNYRFARLGEFNDLKKAVEYHSSALNVAPNDHPHFSTILANLGLSYKSMFEHQGGSDTLIKAIECQSRALGMLPDDHSNIPLQYSALLSTCRLQYPEPLDYSPHRLAAQALAKAPRAQFRYTSWWARLVPDNNILDRLEAYQAVINLLPEFVGLDSTTDHRYDDLAGVEGLVLQAASIAINSSRYALALEWLEHARCIVWNQSIMLRAPIHNLRSLYPDLALKLRVTSDQLHATSFQESEYQRGSRHQADQDRYRLAIEYKALLSQARALPGFSDFLRPMKANSLVRAARYGPIVAINCHEDRSDALVILPGRDDIRHIPLPEFTGQKAKYTRFEMEKSLRNRRNKSRGTQRRPVIPQEEVEFESVLTILWYDVVRPVLDFLGYIHDASTNNLPHITWCPTGLLSFLPLHAAGDYNEHRSKVFDYVISSYAPTVTSLLTHSPVSLDGDTSVLAIGQENTPGHNPLPGTTRELAYVRSHTQGKVKYSELVGSRAGTDIVLDEMERHDWVHLACHAHQNVRDPNWSGFFLHNGTLDLVSINRRSFKNKGLAFLSACQTATGDEELPDEAVHLASGMLMAGYSSVIGTIWSVVDDDAPFVADKVYDQLMKEGKIGSGEAGRALHNAIMELRESVGEKSFGHWAPYIHIGS